MSLALSVSGGEGWKRFRPWFMSVTCLSGWLQGQNVPVPALAPLPIGNLAIGVVIGSLNALMDQQVQRIMNATTELSKNTLY